MGMFDYIDIKVPCPYCGRIVTGFQTKSGACMLDTYKPGDIVSEDDSYNSDEEPRSFSCHASCDHGLKIKEDSDLDILKCTKWVLIEVDIPVIDHVITEDKTKWDIKGIYHEDYGPSYLVPREYSQEEIDDFNNRMIDLEYDYLWEMFIEGFCDGKI
jgi:hypothetical protein